jgi:hypothetical protein
MKIMSIEMQKNDFVEVKLITGDADGEWYLIPIELEDEFNNDLINIEDIDSEFNEKWDQYRYIYEETDLRLFAYKKREN